MPTYPISTEYGSYGWLMREVSGYLGKGYNPDSLDSEWAGKIDSIVQSGLMQFYYPPPLPAGEGEASEPHRWSFLAPVDDIALTSGRREYELPEDFSGMIGDFTIASTEDGDSDPTRISVVEESRLRQLEQTAPRSDLPRYAAVRPKRSEGTASQRWEVLFYPKPNSSRLLYYRYSVSPSPISEERPFPYGGKQHAETILQSCLAVAEERETKTQGPATARFLERMAASIQLDKTSAMETEDGMWPLENEPTDLTIDLDYLKRLVGREMGATSHPATWTHKQTEEVNEAIRSGLRRFYTPAVLPGEKYAHEWSFLRPVETINTVASISEYEMPASYAFMDGSMTYAPGESVLHPPIKRISGHQIREYQQKQVSTGRPELVAVRAKRGEDGQATRYEAIFWPTPDDEYEIRYRYRSNPSLLSQGIAKPAGGMPHSQTIIESCLLSANEMMGKKHDYQKYLELLRASVSHDRIANAPDSLGIIRDGSDDLAQTDWRDFSAQVVTYNGVEY